MHDPNYLRANQSALPVHRDPNKPLVLQDGFVVTDGGHMVMVQYVDIGLAKLEQRPQSLVKLIEAQYGLEYSSTLRLSAPHRYRESGETFIQDDQEGRAHHRVTTKTVSIATQLRSREQQRALLALGQENVTITRSPETSTRTSTESKTFGKDALIYCTSMPPSREDRDDWRRHFPAKYDHESIIRQPSKFAQALGVMLVDQAGPQGQSGTFSHSNSIKSIHDSQLIIHGPVWYTEDVLSFLKAHESDPLFLMYPLFVKDAQYKAQREYRFVVQCENPVAEQHLDLVISGMMRDSLAPRRSVGLVQYEAAVESGKKAPSPTTERATTRTETQTRTRRRVENRRRTLHADQALKQEEVVNREEIVTVTTQSTMDANDDAADKARSTASSVAKVSETETRELRVDGETVDSSRFVRTRVGYIESDEGADDFFDVDEREQATDVLSAAAQPFKGFDSLPPAVSDTLVNLLEQVHGLAPETEIPAMSACWNGIWALCNLYQCFGDIVESVAIEQDEFVAVVLKPPEESGIRGKLLVGPRGTYAYVLQRGNDQRYGYGGEETRLYMFPDERTRDTFAEFGWIPGAQESGHEAG